MKKKKTTTATAAATWIYHFRGDATPIGDIFHIGAATVGTGNNRFFIFSFIGVCRLVFLVFRHPESLSFKRVNAKFSY